MIESYRVSPPSSVGWPPRSRTFSSPSQRRSRLRCNGCELFALERGRGGVVDADIDEGSGLARPREVDGRVASRSTPQPRRVRATGPFDEHLLDPTDPSRVLLLRAALDNLDEPLDPHLFDMSRDLVRGHGRFGALPRRVDQRARAVEGDLLDDLEGLLEVALGLAGEAD